MKCMRKTYNINTKLKHVPINRRLAIWDSTLISDPCLHSKLWSKQSPNSPAKISKTCWPKLRLKSSWTKTKNIRYQIKWDEDEEYNISMVYPSNPVETLPIFWIEMTADLLDHEEFLNGVTILIQMGTAKWKTDENWGTQGNHTKKGTKPKKDQSCLSKT